MKLTLEQIQSIARGVAYVSEENDGVIFHRFTAEQEELYRQTGEDFYRKAQGSAGVRLHFRTDSQTLRFGADIRCQSSSRSRYSFDVYVNGTPIAFFDNDDPSLPYPSQEFPIVPVNGTVDLGAGDKEVQIYFPWSMCPCVTAVELDDSAVVTPVKPSKTMLSFGDSITHGYDALRPSGSYASKLADALDADARNKAIGGEIFFPALAKLKDDITPDYISVAYGTNDWSKCQPDQFCANCREFYKALHDNYPTARIFAITPIWRGDYKDYRPMGDFFLIDKTIRELTADLERVTVIDGFGFVPQDPALFADLRLHPNDAGFEHYAANLIEQVKKIIEG